LQIAVVILAACNETTGGGGDSRAGDRGARDLVAAGEPGPRSDGLGPLPDGSRGDGKPVDGAKPPDAKKPSPDSSQPAKDCAPLPQPTGTIVKVTPAQATQLPGIVTAAKSGTTILLEDGLYKMQGGEAQRRLNFKTAGVTLRSASGDRTKVVIDGEYQTLEMIFIAASDVTIADLTLKRAIDHPVHVTGAPGGAKGTLLYNLEIVDGGEQFVKVNGDGAGNYVDDGRLECSHLELTAAGRPHVEPNPGGCYTGGIDGHGAWGWKVRLNTFKGIYCTSGGLAEHAVHFWTGSRDTLVERNTIIDCGRGVGFGLGQSGAARSYANDPYPGVGYKGHIDGIIRNNVIHVGAAAAAYFDTGIGLEQAMGARVLHNTVVSKPTFSSIDYRFANTKAEIRNNLAFKISVRDGASGSVDHNLEGAPASLFVNATAVNYHLVAGASVAIDKGVVVAGAGLDIDGKAHDAGAPDLGAHEHRP
jgi:hypothetical protein